jgi:hypothetical protein
MTATSIIKDNNESLREYVPMVTSATLLTLILLYIDEGYYNFNWMLDIWNWVLGFMYVGVISIIQIAVYKLILFPLKGTLRTGLSIGIGIFAILATLFFLIF